MYANGPITIQRGLIGIFDLQSGALRRSSGFTSIPPAGIAAAAQWRVSLGVESPSTPPSTHGSPASGPTSAPETVHPILAFERVQEVIETYPEGVPLLSVLTMPQAPISEEATHLKAASQDAPSRADAFQV